MGERMNHDDNQSVDSTIKNKGIFPGLPGSLLLFHQSKKHIFVTLYACGVDPDPVYTRLNPEFTGLRSGSRLADEHQNRKN
jgi:hypothetical protein